MRWLRGCQRSCQDDNSVSCVAFPVRRQVNSTSNSRSSTLNWIFAHTSSYLYRLASQPFMSPSRATQAWRKRKKANKDKSLAKKKSISVGWNPKSRFPQQLNLHKEMLFCLSLIHPIRDRWNLREKRKKTFVAGGNGGNQKTFSMKEELVAGSSLLFSYDWDDTWNFRTSFATFSRSIANSGSALWNSIILSRLSAAVRIWINKYATWYRKIFLLRLEADRRAETINKHTEGETFPPRREDGKCFD